MRAYVLWGIRELNMQMQDCSLWILIWWPLFEISEGWGEQCICLGRYLFLAVWTIGTETALKFLCSCQVRGILNSLYDSCIYRVSQVGWSVFWEFIVSVIPSKKLYITCVLIWKFSKIEIFHSTVLKLLIRKILHTVTYSRFAWRIIMGSGLDEWIYW
jgi:hypothetical protein